MSDDEKIRIAIIEDDPIVRDGLETFFRAEEFCESLCVVDSMEAFFEKLKEGFVADIILSDIGFPGMSGIEGIRLIREKLKSVDIIMLTVFRDEDRIFKSLCAGATGYLLKDTPFNEIKEAISIIRKGGSFMSPAIARKIVEHFNPQPKQDEHNLTPREKQIIQGLVDGLSYKLIADRLTISVDTIRYHIKKIYTKLQINSKSELINKSLKGQLN